MARLIAQALYHSVGTFKVLHRERSAIDGPLLLAANHISHFDPPLISAAAQRKVDWMAMAELFQNPWASKGLELLDAFPADRVRHDTQAVRTALARLRMRRLVGIFPEGGIRAGATSILGGAPLKPGVASIAIMAKAPILPCMVIGSDRLYDPTRWKCGKRSETPLVIAFGEPIPPPTAGTRAEARALLECALRDRILALCSEAQQKFGLTPEDLPQSPAARKGRENADCIAQ